MVIFMLIFSKKIMFVLEHKVKKGRITDITKNMSYDLLAGVHLFKRDPP